MKYIWGSGHLPNELLQENKRGLWNDESNMKHKTPRDGNLLLIVQFAVSAVCNSSTIEWLCKDPVKHHTADRREKDITLID